MIAIEIELPETTLRAAREAGLLTTEALNRLLNEALRRQQVGNSLVSVATGVAKAGVAPMTTEEINAEVKAARAARRQRASGHF